MRRAIADVDGFNLYNGMRAAGWQRFYWLNVAAFVETFLDAESQRLAGVKYFTAMVQAPKHDPDKRLRQVRYIDALRTVPNVEILFGYYMARRRRCPLCDGRYKDYEEKSTDVCMASHMLVDAHSDRFDDLLLVSADGDLRVPLALLHSLFPHKGLNVVFPPHRVSKELRRLERAGICRCLHATHTNLRAAQFPDVVIGDSGHPLHRPESWR